LTFTTEGAGSNEAPELLKDPFRDNACSSMVCFVTGHLQSSHALEAGVKQYSGQEQFPQGPRRLLSLSFMVLFFWGF
jgi:hypothetical protein